MNLRDDKRISNVDSDDLVMVVKAGIRAIDKLSSRDPHCLSKATAVYLEVLSFVLSETSVDESIKNMEDALRPGLRYRDPELRYRDPELRYREPVFVPREAPRSFPPEISLNIMPDMHGLDRLPTSTGTFQYSGLDSLTFWQPTVEQ